VNKPADIPPDESPGILPEKLPAELPTRSELRAVISEVRARVDLGETREEILARFSAMLKQIKGFEAKFSRSVTAAYKLLLETEKLNMEEEKRHTGENDKTVNVNTGIKIETPADPQRASHFQGQLAAMLASMLQPSTVDAYLPAGGSGQPEEKKPEETA
jgi:hypothetical protein